jgi:hypothetical protein
MNNLLWKKVVFGTTLCLGTCAFQMLPAKAITIGFDPDSFTALDSEPPQDLEVLPGQQFSLNVVIDVNDLADGLSVLEYEILVDGAEVDTIDTISFKWSGDNFPSNAIASNTDNDTLPYDGNDLEVSHTDGSVAASNTGPQQQFEILDTIIFTATTSLDNSDVKDIDLTPTLAKDMDGNIIADANNDEFNFTIDGTDQEGEIQPPAAVPFEAETGMGLVTLAGLFGVRKFRQMKARCQANPSA